jgi:predicted unusual protein kinase regulating ubiquinone biosynthesis (AarF/ABC1/UbiB family)
MFINLGQMLLRGSDLLPKAYRNKLTQLRDEVPPLPEEAMADIN